MATNGRNQDNDMGLTSEDVERILRIIDESGYDEIRVEHGDLKVHMRRRDVGMVADPPEVSPLPEPRQAGEAAGAAAAPPPAAAGQIPEGLIAVRAPMLGTFYRAPAPGAPPFAEEGAMVTADSPVCLIEVMKLFNTLKAAVAGRVVRFLVENGTMVEYDQPLILIEPSAKR